MPPGPIQDEDDLFGGTGADLARKRRQFHFKERNAHAGRQMKDGPTRKPTPYMKR